MRSQVELFLQPLSITELSLDSLHHLSKLPLKMAQSSRLILAEGTILTQSFSHYAVHIRLHEYSISKHRMIDIEVTEPSFFMMAMLEGCSVLYNEAGDVVSEIFGNSCQLSYLAAGKYQYSLQSGDHRTLLLTISPDCLVKRYGDQEELKELISSYRVGKRQNYSLPNLYMGQQIFNALLKLNNSTDLDIDIYVFLNECFDRYCKRLQVKVSNAEYQKNKAREIGEFIIHNFAHKIVTDETGLARHFMVSTKTLRRLGRLHFGVALHKQVIELRLLNGLRELLITKKTVRQVALGVGYQDAHYFSKAFKKRFGVRPNEVRSFIF